MKYKHFLVIWSFPMTMWEEDEKGVDGGRDGKNTSKSERTEDREALRKIVKTEGSRGQRGTDKDCYKLRAVEDREAWKKIVTNRGQWRTERHWERLLKQRAVEDREAWRKIVTKEAWRNIVKTEDSRGHRGMEKDLYEVISGAQCYLACKHLIWHKVVNGKSISD